MAFRGGEATDGSYDEEESSDDEGTPLDPPGPVTETRTKAMKKMPNWLQATTGIDTNHCHSALHVGRARRRQSQNRDRQGAGTVRTC